MLEVSSSGLGQPKQKSINVEVNLLSEWLQSRARRKDQLARMGLLSVCLTLTAVVTLPALNGLRVEAESRAAAAKAKVTHLEESLSKLRQEREAAKPRLDLTAMRGRVKRQANTMLGNTTLVLNAATVGMAFESISVDIVGGDLTVRCKAEAESDAIAQAFLERAGKGPGALSSLLSTARRSEQLGPDGVAFEFVKKVGVTP